MPCLQKTWCILRASNADPHNQSKLSLPLFVCLTTLILPLFLAWFVWLSVGNRAAVMRQLAWRVAQSEERAKVKASGFWMKSNTVSLLLFKCVIMSWRSRCRVMPEGVYILHSIQCFNKEMLQIGLPIFISLSFLSYLKQQISIPRATNPV